MTMQVATNPSEIHEKLLNLGWTLGKIDRKGDMYVAKANNDQTGQDIERTGKTPAMALAAVYQYAQRATAVRRMAATKIAAWDTDWLSEKDEIAKAYAQLPAFDEKAAPAWKALAAESKIQADAIRQQITVDITDDPEPYMTAKEMVDDIHKNKHFTVSRANCDHPIWSVEDNVNFRIVHDVLGHAQSGGDFSWRGENLACGVHFPLVSPLAREALFTECIGQVAYRSAFKGFGPQKIGLLSQHLAPAQEKHGEHVFVPHGGLPQFNAPANGAMGGDMLDQASGEANVQGPGTWVAPQNYVPSPTFGLGNPVMQGFDVKTHTSGRSPLVPGFQHQSPYHNQYRRQRSREEISRDLAEVRAVLADPNVDPQTKAEYQNYLSQLERENRPSNRLGAKTVSPDRPHDPNAFWTPGHSVPPINFNEQPEADYIDAAATTINAAKIDSDWQSEDEATQRLAIMNAFRVALLSPRKHLRWNAAHYQALMHADPATKAVDLWYMLEEARETHNQGKGYPDGSHLSYKNQLDFLTHEIAGEEGITPAEARKEAKSIIFNKIKEFEAQLGEEEGDTSELKRYLMARKMTDAWLKENYNPLRGWRPGQMSLFTAAREEKAAERLRQYRERQLGLRGFGEQSDSDFGERAAEEIVKGEALARDVAATLPPEEWPDWVRNNIRRQMGTNPKQWWEEGYISPIHDKTPGDTTFPDDWVAKTAGAPQLFPHDDEWKPLDASGFSNDDAKYGAFMGGHLDAIEQVGKHIDAIRDAALEDMESGGKGFKFRNAIMNMNLAGVNPKVASFAWLLLNPLGSELGIIDAHVIRGMRRSENDMNPRDYYKFERMQRAGKDATGYSHMPLGLYHWGLWDAIRNPGEHSDHSPLRVLDPLAWDGPDAKWDAATNAKSGPWVGPEAFENGRGHIERAASDFDQEFMGQPLNLVPLAQRPNHQPHEINHFKIPAA